MTYLSNELAAAQLLTEVKLKTLSDSVDTLVWYYAESQGPPADAESQPPTLATPVGSELQALTRQVQHKYKSVTLDSIYKLYKNHVGVRREDQKALNVI